MNPLASTRHAQRLEELCAGTIRALTGDAALHLRAQRLFRGERALPLPAPHLQTTADHNSLRSLRGAADGQALRLVLSDAALHRSRCPAHPVERWVFELLEQFRVEALVPAALVGVRQNLRLRFEDWSHGVLQARGLETERGLVLYTVAQMCRSRVTGEPVFEPGEDAMEATRLQLAGSIGHELAALRRDRHQQGRYAAAALMIAKAVRGWLGDGAGDEAEAASRSESLLGGFALRVDFDAEPELSIAKLDNSSGRVLTEAEHGYRVFTRAHDREHAAATLVRPAQLREYRTRLDERIAAQGVSLSRLARELKLLLAEPTSEGWSDGQEAGLIDGARLSQLVASPAERRLFRGERWEPVAHTAVSFLIDCSGSMKQHMETVAVLVDLFARALEAAGATCEVLGFSTSGWNGGECARDWQRAGRPSLPGRLNGLSHLVFKEADTPWRRARGSIAALLKADLFREGIDGEAVLWAAARLAARSEPRRVLLVVSDGSPMDTATSLANDAQYLDRHLRQVVSRLEQQPGLMIAGLGVGLDLSPYYRRCCAIDLAVPPGWALVREVMGLLAGSKPSRQVRPR